MTLEELQIILKVNNEQLISGLKDSVNHINKMQNSVSGSMTKIKSSFKSLATFVVGLGIGKILKDSITAGMDSVEADNRFQILFQGYAGEMRQWSNELEKSLGINGYAARSAASDFYELATAQGVSTDVAKEMSKSMTQAAYDIASFKDKDPSQVLKAMQSAFVGNTEALRSMGYVVTADMVKQKAYQSGIAATGTQLTQTQKAMATYQLIMEQMGQAHGDLARTINSPSNQLRILREQLTNLRIELGRAFLPIVQIILPLLNAFVTKLIQVVKVFGQFMQALFGKPIGGTGGSGDAIQDAVGNVGDLTGGLGQAEQAAKKAKNALMGFDELNTLSPKAQDTALDTGVGGGGSIDVPSLDVEYGEMEEIPAKIQAMADKVKAILGNLKDFLEEHKELILAVIGGIIAGFAAFETLTFLSNIPAMITAISGALTALTSPIALAAAGIGALVAVFLYLYQTNEDFRNKMNALWGELGQIFVNFKNDVLAPFGEFFMNEFLAPMVEGFQTYMLPAFAEAFVGAQQILNSFIEHLLQIFGDLLELLKPILKLISDVIVDCMKIAKNLWDEYGQQLINNALGVIESIKQIWGNLYETVLKPIIGNAVEMLRNLWNDHLKGLVESFIEFKVKLVNGAMELYNEFIAPIVNWIIDVFGPAFVTIFNFIVDQIGVVLGVFFDFKDMIFEVLGGLIDFIVGAFTGNWDRAWSGIKQIFQGVWDGIKNILDGVSEYFVNVWTFIKDIVVQLVEALVTTVCDFWQVLCDRVASLGEWLSENITEVWTTIKDFIGGILETIGKFISGAWEGVKTTTETIFGGIGTFISNIWNGIKDAITGVLDAIGNAISNTWETIKNITETIFGGVKEFVGNTWNGIKEAVGGAVDGAKERVGTAWDNMKEKVSTASENIKEKAGTAWNNIKENIRNTNDNIKEKVSTTWNSVKDSVSTATETLGNKIKTTWETAKTNISNVQSNISQVVTNSWNAIKNSINNVLEGVKAVVTNAWNGIKNTVTNTLNSISQTVTNVWNTIKTFITNTLNSIRNIVTNAWNGVQSTTSNILNNIRNTVSNAWNGITNTISNVVNTIKNTVTNAFNSVKSTMSNLASWISGTFRNLWSNAWNGVVNIFNNIWNGLTRAVKTPLNFIIDCVNTVIRGLNRIKLPDWAGGFGINIREIPRLAQGGIIDKPTIAQVGEAGPEMVVPLKNTPFVTTLANAVANATAASLSHLFDDGTQQETATPIVITMDGMEMARATVNNINRLSKVTGQNMLRV